MMLEMDGGAPETDANCSTSRMGIINTFELHRDTPTIPHPTSSKPFYFDPSTGKDSSSPHAEEDAEKENQDYYGDIPVACSCPYCHKTVVTNVEFQTGCLTIILCFLVFLVFGWLSFCIIPFIYPLLQDTCHYCPRCLNLIEKRQRIKCPKIANEVMTLRCGNCAVVLSRKYVLILMVMSLLILFANMARWYIKAVGLPDYPKGPEISDTWQDFIDHCGFRSYLGNPIHSNKAFESKYHGATVMWEGRVHKIQEGILSKNFLYVMMDPPQFRDSPDIALMFGKSLDAKVGEVHPADMIEFEATLLELGRRGRPHLGILRDLNITAKHDELPPMHDSLGMAMRRLTGNPLHQINWAHMMRSIGGPQVIRIVQVRPMGEEEDDEDDDDDEVIALHLPSLVAKDEEGEQGAGGMRQIVFSDGQAPHPSAEGEKPQVAA